MIVFITVDLMCKNHNSFKKMLQEIIIVVQLRNIARCLQTDEAAHRLWILVLLSKNPEHLRLHRKQYLSRRFKMSFLV